MRKLIKKILPYSALRLAEKIIVPIAVRYYSTRYSPLIVRKNTTDSQVFRQIFIQKDYNLPIKVKPKLIIDAGAYVGYSALYFSSKYPGAKIISIEPEKSNFKILKENTRNIPNIKIINAGLWHKKGFLKIINNGLGHWGFETIQATPKDYDIKTTTISEVLKNSGFKEIDILKIDIEGAEKEVFSSNHQWLDKVKILIIELHERMNPGCKKAFDQAVKKHRWKKIIKGENIILIRQE
jgi:FkbM family methyltransferase